MNFQPTRPTTVAIAERRPDPQGRPGYLHVDTVRQGDLDGSKGLYHINAVDKTTEFQLSYRRRYFAKIPQRTR